MKNKIKAALRGDADAITISERQVELMQHAIGYSPRRVKRGKYVAYRNYFAAPALDIQWEDLMSKGLAGRSDDDNAKYVYYYVTRAGMGFLQNVTGIKIMEDD